MIDRCDRISQIYARDKLAINSASSSSLVFTALYPNSRDDTARGVVYLYSIYTTRLCIYGIGVQLSVARAAAISFYKS